MPWISVGASILLAREIDDVIESEALSYWWLSINPLDEIEFICDNASGFESLAERPVGVNIKNPQSMSNRSPECIHIFFKDNYLKYMIPETVC